MNTTKKENKKKNSTAYAVIVVVMIGLLVIAGWLATSNFDFVNFVIKLHGG